MGVPSGRSNYSGSNELQEATRMSKTNIGLDELKGLLDSGGITLLDVRRKADYEAEPQSIPGAVWRDPAQVEVWGRGLPQDRPVVVYCVKGGSVSQSIVDHLLGRQVQACYVEGGLKAWKESGGPVEKTVADR
jgi:rhodanese-related sulfurtransferase